MKSSLLAVLVLLPFSPTVSASWSSPPVPVGFIENSGQLDEAVLYYAPGAGADIYLTRGAVVLDLHDLAGAEREAGSAPPGARAAAAGAGWFRSASDAGQACAVYVRFRGANPWPLVDARGELPGRYNYLLGNDPSRWRTGVRAYAEIVYHDLWPGIDLVYGQEGGGVSFRIELAPSADPSQVAFDYDGADQVMDLGGGAFPVETAAGSHLADNPDALLWSTFLGGSFYDYGYSVCLDSAGNPVVRGYTLSPNFPTTPGAYDRSLDYDDVFIAKIDASGSRLLWGTFLGGNGGEYGTSLSLDPSGNPVVTGWTWSPDFPTTPGAYDPTRNGGEDVFVTKLDASGSRLLWSTFLGAGGDDEGHALCLDPEGNPVVTGATGSSDFPTTSGAWDPSYNGGWDVFVAKLDSSGSSLLGSTFLGGSGDDYGRSLVLDGTGDVVVTGETSSYNFPTTPDAYDPAWNVGSGVDGFVAKLDASASVLWWSTYLRGGGDDYGRSVGLDPSGNPVVTGETRSADFPTTPGAYDRSHNGGRDAFLAKLDASGSSLLWSSYLGGDSEDYGRTLLVAPSGNLVVTGWTYSPGFPVTPGAYDLSYNGHGDAFVTEMDGSGGMLLWSTFLGGNETDGGYGLAGDPSETLVVTGWAGSGDFPTTPGVYDPSWNGGYTDVFVAKFQFPRTDVQALTAPGTEPELRAEARPNPTSQGAFFRLALSAPGPVSVSLFDAAGRLVRVLPETMLGAGLHQLAWDGRDAGGFRVPPGVYFFAARVGERSCGGKLVIVR